MTVMETVLTVAVVILCGCLIMINHRVNEMENRFNEWSKGVNDLLDELIINVKKFW